MRVLHLDTEKTWRGGENQLRLLHLGLQERGFQSSVACVPASEVARRLEPLGPVIPIKRGGYDLATAFLLARQVRAGAFQVIDAHTAATHSLGLLVKKLVPQVKLVVHRRVDNPIKHQLVTRWKYLSPGVDHYVAISAAIGEILRHYGLGSERISVVKSATEMGRFKTEEKIQAKKRFADQWGLSTQALWIGNASALDSQKDPLTLVQAFARLRQKTSQEVALVLAGEGDLRPQIEGLVERLGLAAHVRLVGFRRDVRDFLLALDLVALPSVNEGLGTTLLDSLLCGCAVVATRVGGIPEIIVEGITGLLVQPQDPDGLANCLIRLMENLEERKRLVEASCLHVTSHFSVDAMVEGNLAVYRKLLV